MVTALDLLFIVHGSILTLLLRFFDSLACGGIGGDPNTETVVTIGQGSCLGLWTCFELGYKKKTTIRSTTVGNNSCHGHLGCKVDPLNRLPGTSFTIHDNSCIAPDEENPDNENASCYNAGARADVVEIGPNSCVGFGACWSIGEQATRSVIVHANSLHGCSACGSMGYSSESVEVEENACVCPSLRSEWEAGTCCYMMAFESPASVEVQAGACSAPRACQDVARGATNLSLLRLFPGACSADLSCNGLALDFDHDSAEAEVMYLFVQENVCDKEEACMNCLSGMTSSEIGTDDLGLTVSDAAQCPDGPFDYWGP